MTTTNDTPDTDDEQLPPEWWHRPRDGTGRFQRSMESVRRDAAAAEYKSDHPAATLREIAERFGYCDRGEARRGILRAKADVARPAIDKLIGDESQELDALYTEAVAILRRRHVTVSHGKIITWRNPDTGEDDALPDDGPALQAIQVALKVRESYRKLHGLDQPSQVAVSGGVKYEVVGVNTEDLT